MPERLMVRTEGGPNPGTKLSDKWDWPLPELLLADGGWYVKVSEGDLYCEAATRGARYEWQPGDAPADQLTVAIGVALRARRLDEAVGLMHLLAVQDPHRAEFLYDLVTLLGGSDDR